VPFSAKPFQAFMRPAGFVAGVVLGWPFATRLMALFGICTHWFTGTPCSQVGTPGAGGAVATLQTGCALKSVKSAAQPASAVTLANPAAAPGTARRTA